MADRNSTARESVDAQLRAFIVEFQPWLLGRARRICPNEADAQELVQRASERFLTSLSRLPRLPPKAKLEGWLIVTMTNDFNTRNRKRMSEKKGVLDPTLEGMTMGQPPELERLFSEAEEDVAFDAAMKELSPTLRATVEMHLKGKSYREISKSKRIPTGTVGKRLTDARKKLVSLLAPFISSREH